MQDLLYIHDAAQAAALLQPLRMQLLKRMGEPCSCPELAGALGLTTQKVNYHVRKLTDAGLVEKVRERRVRGILEGVYQARAASYWLSPRLVDRIGGAGNARERLSLGFLLNLAEELQEDIGRLAERAGGDVASMGLSAEIELANPKRRNEFRKDVEQTFQRLAHKYGAQGPRKRKSQSYRLMLACYENPGTGGNK